MASEADDLRRRLTAANRRLAESRAKLEQARTQSQFSSAPCVLCRYENGKFVEACTPHKDLAACEAAYAHVCEAIVPGGGPGGAGAMAVMVLLFKKERDDARAAVQAADEWAVALSDALTEARRRAEIVRAAGLPNYVFPWEPAHPVYGNPTRYQLEKFREGLVAKSEPEPSCEHGIPTSELCGTCEAAACEADQ